MDSQRNFFLISFLFISFIIWQTWQSEDFSILKKTEKQKTPLIQKTNNDLLNIKNKILVENDVLSLLINLDGGNIEQAKLLTYSEKLGSSVPFILLQTTPYFLYQAQSGIIKINDNETIKQKPTFYTEHKKYKINNDQKELSVPMIFKDNDGITYTKTFILKKNEYAVTIDYKINNLTQKTIEIKMFGELKQTFSVPENYLNNNFAFNSFRGAAYSTNKIKYKKYKFDNIINNENLNILTEKGWIAMLQQYFVTAWIPTSGINNLFYTYATDKNTAVIIGYESYPITIDSGSQKSISSILWIGPEIQNKMAFIAPNLDLTVDYGWLWFISQPLFKLLKFIYNYVENWGFSIIIITLMMRILMYPLTKAQYSSAAKMRMLQPKIQEMNEKFSHNKQRLSQEMLNLYKIEKVNPLGGCLPLLIQMPIFLALYYMLISSVELRHAHFIFWIYDLSAQDPYYVLPAIMCVTMFVIQKMSPATVTDPIQKKIMNYMPMIFTLFFLWCPSGLVLYYIVSNLVTIIQQKLIYSSLKQK